MIFQIEYFLTFHQLVTCLLSYLSIIQKCNTVLQHFCKYFSYLFDLFKRKGYRERETENISIFWITPQMATTIVRARPGQSQVSETPTRKKTSASKFSQVHGFSKAERWTPFDQVNLTLHTHTDT